MKFVPQFYIGQFAYQIKALHKGANIFISRHSSVENFHHIAYSDFLKDSNI